MAPTSTTSATSTSPITSDTSTGPAPTTGDPDTTSTTAVDTGTIASWSSSEGNATDFTWDGARKGELGVLMRMVPRHGARIDALSRYADEAEFISSGRVRVVRVTETPEYLLVDVEPLPLDDVAKRRPEPVEAPALDAEALAAILAAFGRRQVRSNGTTRRA